MATEGNNRSIGRLKIRRSKAIQKTPIKEPNTPKGGENQNLQLAIRQFTAFLEKKPKNGRQPEPEYGPLG
jgi:hypothetical protein